MYTVGRRGAHLGADFQRVHRLKPTEAPLENHIGNNHLSILKVAIWAKETREVLFQCTQENHGSSRSSLAVRRSRQSIFMILKTNSLSSFTTSRSVTKLNGVILSGGFRCIRYRTDVKVSSFTISLILAGKVQSNETVTELLRVYNPHRRNELS